MMFWIDFVPCRVFCDRIGNAILLECGNGVGCATLVGDGVVVGMQTEIATVGGAHPYGTLSETWNGTGVGACLRTSFLPNTLENMVSRNASGPFRVAFRHRVFKMASSNPPTPVSSAPPPSSTIPAAQPLPTKPADLVPPPPSDIHTNNPSTNAPEEPFFSTSLLFRHIAYFTFRRPPRDDAEYAVYRAALESYYDAHDRFLFFFDVRDLEGINEYFIWKKAELMQELKPRTQKKCVCTAIVMNSEPVRFLLNGFFRLYNLTAPHQLFTDDASATEWLTQWLIKEFGTEEAMRCLG